MVFGCDAFEKSPQAGKSAKIEQESGKADKNRCSAVFFSGILPCNSLLFGSRYWYPASAQRRAAKESGQDKQQPRESIRRNHPSGKGRKKQWQIALK